ncbi:MAG: hypothetical protein WCS42_23930, partial [Verrucomicrobiota bacterium]
NPSPTACIFIFDWKLEASQRLGIPACGTEAECLAALATGIVIFNPFIMFKSEPGMESPDKRAFRWFCQWVYAQCQTGPGKKILFADELKMFVESRADMLPVEFETVLRQGRGWNLELLTATQFPKDYARPIRASVTEWVCFSTDEPDDLDAVRPYFRGVDRVSGLPRGSFIAYNRDSGAELCGKLF